MAGARGRQTFSLIDFCKNDPQKTDRNGKYKGTRDEVASIESLWGRNDAPHH